MKTRYIYFILLMLITNRAEAQYKGGIEDGTAIKSSPSQNQTPNIFKGGNNDGHAYLLISGQNQSPGIYFGGGNDGVATRLISGLNESPNIYTGGGNDGTAIANVLSLNQSPGIYFGGANDGIASLFVAAQNPGVTIYFGGANDGASAFIAASQNSLPGIYFGGGNDGVASVIVLNQNTSDPLPILLFSFDGLWMKNDAQLNWETNETIEINYFDLERSLDGGLSFEPIARLLPNDEFSKPVYEHLDTNAWDLPSDVLLYRLKLVSISEKENYSTIVKLEKSRTAPVLTAYPNPSNGKLTLHIQNTTDLSEYKYQLYNITGQSLESGPILTAKSSFDFSRYTSGMYQLVIYNHDIAIQNFKIILNQ